MKWLIKQFRQEEWSPYIAGTLLGIVGILAVVLSNSLLGASGAFENIAGLIGQAVAPEAFDNIYFNFVMPPGITWGVLLVIGIFFGGMWGAKSSGTWKWRMVSDEQWKTVVVETLVNRFCGGHHFGIRRGHCWGLHQWVSHLWGDVVSTGRFSFYCRYVCLWHCHGLGCLR